MAKSAILNSYAKSIRLTERFAMRSTSDSEVLLYLYKLLGIGFLNELSGMFAFCIVDRAQE
jgi:asparagine synthetase B (glutamine-hydrolysing)